MEDPDCCGKGKRPVSIHHKFSVSIFKDNKTEQTDLNLTNFPPVQTITTDLHLYPPHHQSGPPYLILSCVPHGGNTIMNWKSDHMEPVLS